MSIHQIRRPLFPDQPERPPLGQINTVVTRAEKIKGIKQIKPVKTVKEAASSHPVLFDSWSKTSLTAFFMAEEKGDSESRE